jgi:N-methylhydantoinase A
VTARVSAFGDLERHEPEGLRRGKREPPEDARAGDRRALVHGLARPQRVAVFRREGLRARNVLDGPAIVEEMDATTVIGRDQRATVDAEGNLWLRAAR